MLFWVVARKAGSNTLTSARIAKLRNSISDAEIGDAIDAVASLFFDEGGTDQLAKGPLFKEKLKAVLTGFFAVV